jgi:hypothetical protein
MEDDPFLDRGLAGAPNSDALEVKVFKKPEVAPSLQMTASSSSNGIGESVKSRMNATAWTATAKHLRTSSVEPESKLSYTRHCRFHCM